MNRRLVTLVFFTLCLCETASAQTLRSGSTVEATTPAWLPRAAYLGTSLADGAVVLQARLQWQFMFYQGRRDALGVFLEPLVGLSLATPSTLTPDPFGSQPAGSLTALQLYSLVGSVGYVNRQESGLEWGFQVGSGPAWFQARFQGASKSQESYWVGLLDGRVHLGYHLGPVGLGVAVGYGDSYNYKRSSLAHGYVGGLQLGLYADWR